MLLTPNNPINRYLSKLSIKRLTIVGFILAITPLLSSLLYIAEQTKRLSNEGAQAIIEVSRLVEANRTLNLALTRAERYASQYIVLKEQELLDRLTVEHFKTTNIIDTRLKLYHQDKLNSLLNQLSEQISFVIQTLPKLPKTFDELIEIEQHFQHINQTSNAIRQRSEQLIQQQALHIRRQADGVDNIVLKSLFTVPVTLVITTLFIYLITQPLKTLITQIQTLQQSKFNQKISSSGAFEIQEITHALDIMRTRLHALELQKSSFIRHISHELKTPLAAIREGSALLDDNSVGALNDGQREVSQIIVESVNRLQLLIEDLLAFNIVLDSTSLQDSEPLSMSNLINEVITHHKLPLSRKQINIDFKLGTIGIYSNKKQLSVIIDNLLSNAIKYTPHQGKITIATTLNDKQLLLTVSDNGQGIEKEEIDQIFNAFYQGAKSNNSHIKSSGLGLTIVKELVMRLNGTIEVSSHLPSQNDFSGSIFTITLPRAYLLPKATKQEH